VKVLLLMLSPAGARGGMEKHVQELANGLAGVGVDVSCMACPEHLQSLHPAVHKLPVNTDASRYSVYLYRHLIRALRSEQFDVVHAQGSKAASVIQRLTPWFRQSRFVASIHNFKSRYPDTRRFSRIIAVSKALGADIEADNVSVVYNGIAPVRQPVDPDYSIADPENPRWLAVGRLVPAKGFDRLIPALRQARGSLTIAGYGPERARLEILAGEPELQGRVHLAGYQNNVAELMDRADGVVIPSYREGFSYVFAEALLAGKPVIATDVPIANEFLPASCIAPNDCGADTLAALLNQDLQRLHADQAGARERARKELTLDAMTHNTLQIYSESLDSRR
jgi:glycosyltransferase involved in cell wall biosynthesis